MPAGKPVLIRPLLLLGVAVVCWVAVVPRIPQYVTFQPPSGPAAVPVSLPPLPEPDLALSAEEYWEQKAAAEVMLHQLRKSLGDIYATGFLNEAGPTGPFEVIVLATEERDIPGVTVIEVPHSHRDLERVETWLRDQIATHDPPIHAELWMSFKPRGVVVLDLCAPPDSSLNLSFLPATAVRYQGECIASPDPSNEL